MNIIHKHITLAELDSTISIQSVTYLSQGDVICGTFPKVDPNPTRVTTHNQDHRYLENLFCK